MKNWVFAILLAVLAPTFSWSAQATSQPATVVKSSGVREIVLSKDNTLILDAEIDGESVSKVLVRARELDAANKSGYPIRLFLNTPGGSIQDGLELFEGLKSINRPVDTITLFAASMGFQTVQNLGRRYILGNGVLMSHKARGGFQGEFGDGFSQLDSRYALWMDRILAMDSMTVKRTNGKQTLKSYRAQYENELWMTGAKAVSLGYADEVVTVRCDKTLSGTHDQSFYSLGMEIRLSFSDCPIITYPVSVEVVLPTNKGVMTLTDFLAKGGVFKSKDDSSYSSPELHVTDLSLTLAQVRKAVQDYKKELRNSLDNKKIIRGY